MKTRKQVIEYLLSEGAPLNYVRAAVNECYNYDDEGGEPGLIGGQDENDLSIKTEVTKEQAMMMYNTMEEMFSIENEQILIDGDPTYDIHGHHLSYDSKLV